MNVIEFSDTLLPHLLLSYTRGEIPFHALVDLDLWRQLFPDDAARLDDAEALAPQFDWHEVRIAGHSLPDGTLLLTYTLPQPKAPGDPKYAAIRIDRRQQPTFHPDAPTADDTATSEADMADVAPAANDEPEQPPVPAVIYTLRQPASPHDQWDVHYLPLPMGEAYLEQRFRCKIEGHDTLRNFILCVQQISFRDNLYQRTWRSRLKAFIEAALTPQPEEPVLRLS